MLSGSALDAPLTARETRLDERDESATGSAPGAQSPSAPDAMNTLDTQIEEIPGETEADPGLGLNPVEQQYLSALISRGVGPADAARQLLDMRKRRGVA